MRMVRDRRLPAALAHWPRIRRRLQGRQPLLFLSYDGALAPLVSREDMAVLSRGMKEVLRQLAGLCPTVIVSRRGRQDLASMVDIDGLFHAGSDGLDFSGPGLSSGSRTKAEWVVQIRSLAADLVQAYLGTNGVLVDPRDITLRLHLDPPARAHSDDVERILDSVLRDILGSRRSATGTDCRCGPGWNGIGEERRPGSRLNWRRREPDGFPFTSGPPRSTRQPFRC